MTKKEPPFVRPTIEEVAERAQMWLQIYGPELMRRKAEKDNAAAQSGQSLTGPATPNKTKPRHL